MHSHGCVRVGVVGPQFIKKKKSPNNSTAGVCVLLLPDTLTHFWLSDSYTRRPTHVHAQVSLDVEPKAHYFCHLIELQEVKICT